MNIGKLSEKVGLPAKTIRYYEEVGLISRTGRSENGYRNYENSNIEELTIIKNARELGLPIEKIKKLMVGCKGGDCAHSKEYLIEEIDSYLQVLQEKESQLTILKSKLVKLKKTYGKNLKTKYCCNILGQLTEMEGSKAIALSERSEPKGGESV